MQYRCGLCAVELTTAIQPVSLVQIIVTALLVVAGQNPPPPPSLRAWALLVVAGLHGPGQVELPSALKSLSGN